MGAAVAGPLLRPPADVCTTLAGRPAAARYHAAASNRALGAVYLIDTNVISAGAPSRAAPPALIAWMDHHSAQLFISAVTVAEIEDGIAKARREGATRKAAE